jgi:uncharacterized membrane protein
MSRERPSCARRPVRPARVARRVRRFSWIRLGLIAAGLVCLALGACACIGVWTTRVSAPFTTVVITILAFAWLIVPGLMLVQVGAACDDSPDD